MRYKEAHLLDELDFKRLYGVSKIVFEKMILEVFKAKQGKQGSISKLSRPRPNFINLAIGRENIEHFFI